MQVQLRNLDSLDLNFTDATSMVRKMVNIPLAVGAGAGLATGFVLGTGVGLAFKVTAVLALVGVGYYVSTQSEDMVKQAAMSLAKNIAL